MRFKHAAKGVTKIFLAELFSVFAFCFIGAALVLALVFGALKEMPDTALVGFFVSVVSAAVLLLGSGVLKVVGYIQAAKDEEGFVRAIICAIVALVLGIIASLFHTQTGALAWVHTILSAAALLAQMFVLIAAIGGLISLSEQCRRVDMVRRGNTILMIVEVIYVLTFIGIILQQLFGVIVDKAVVASITAALGILIIVLMVIQTFLLLGYLKKAGKMLRETP